MKRNLIIVILYVSSFATFGQKNYQDVLYLKNDSIIKGIVFEQIPYQYLRIYTLYGDSLRYSFADIQKISREPVMNPNESADIKPGLKTGYTGIVEVGISRPNSKYDFTEYLKLNVINGYRFNPHLFIGGGVGLRYFLNPHFEQSPVFNNIGLPFFFDVRNYFFTEKCPIFIEFSFGYSFDIHNNDLNSYNPSSSIRGVGLLLSPTAGINYNISDLYSISLGLSYEYQGFKKISLDCPQCQINMVSSSDCLSINLGLSF